MAPSRKKGAAPGSLFSSSTYDRDASTYSSVPTTEDIRASSSSHLELGSDEGSDDDDDLSTTPQDLDVLKEEEEREKLLSKGGLFGSIGRREGVVIGKRVKGARRKKRPGLGVIGREDSEERVGGGAGEYSSGEDGYGEESEDEDLEEIRKGWMDEKDRLRGEPRPRTPSIRRVMVISTGLLSLLILLIYASLRLSLPKSKSTSPPSTSNPPTEKSPFHATQLSNGTHTYQPTTILISLDGFRASYLSRKLTPTIQSFINSGLSTPYLIPSFPSVTFPNHWTLVTGLYPESHGIVGNSFWDPATKQEYYYTDRKSSTQPFWYGGDPIWSVAEENGVKTAIHMWPGSETYLYHPEAFVSTLEEFKAQKPTADGKRKRMKPSIVDEYNGKELLSNKVARLLGWLDLPLEERPQLILGYVPNLDAVGHKFGPDTDEEAVELGRVDDMFRLLLEGIETRNLTDIVNLVVVSDHGMTKTKTEKLIYLEDVLGKENVQKVGKMEGWPLSGFRPVEGIDDKKLWEDIKARQTSWPPNTATGKNAQMEKDGKKVAPWNVYHKNQDMPKRLHFSNSDRIAPIWIIPQVGWVCVTKSDYPPENMPAGGYYPKGVHGYDNIETDMRALFVGWGPGFRDLGLHGEGREWLGLGGAGNGGVNFDVHDAIDDAQSSDKLQLKKREDIKGNVVSGTHVAPFGNWNVYSIIGELVFGAENSRKYLGLHNGTLGLGGVWRGKKSDSVLDALEVLTKEQFEKGDYAFVDVDWDSLASSSPSSATELSSSSAIPLTEVNSETSITSTATRPVIVKPKPSESAIASTVLTGLSATVTESKGKIEVDEPTENSKPSASSPASGDKSHNHNDDDSDDDDDDDDDDSDSDDEEEEDLNHKPENMTWWQWAKWRAKKLKEKLENWWGEVWDDKDGEKEKGGKHEGKGP